MISIDSTEALFNDVPAYGSFFDVEHLAEHSQGLPRRYPSLARTEIIGYSGQGQPIWLDKINDHDDPDQRKALYVGTVHANELAGGLAALHTEEVVCANPQLLKSLGDCALWVIKTGDPDGVREQRWNRDGYSPLSYMQGLLRQQGSEQLEWGFAGIADETARPEVATLATVITEAQPHFYYPLHNASFSSGYVYATKAIPSLYEPLRNELSAVGLHNPINTEALSEEPLAPGIYEFQLKPNGKKSSFSLAHTVQKDCLAIMPEVPYFISHAMTDNRPSRRTLDDEVKWFCEKRQQDFDILDPYINKFSEYDSVHVRASMHFRQLFDGVPELSAHDTPQELTVADVAIRRTKSLYPAAYIGQIGTAAAEVGDYQAKRAIDAYMSERLSEVEQYAPLATVPPRDLIRFQARVGILAMQCHFSSLENS